MDRRVSLAEQLEDFPVGFLLIGSPGHNDEVHLITVLLNGREGVEAFNLGDRMPAGFVFSHPVLAVGRVDFLLRVIVPQALGNVAVSGHDL